MVTHLPTLLICGVAYGLGSYGRALFGGTPYWELIACAVMIMVASSFYRAIHFGSRLPPLAVWPVAAAILGAATYRILLDMNLVHISYWGEVTLPDWNGFAVAVIVTLTLIMGYSLNHAIAKACPQTNY